MKTRGAKISDAILCQTLNQLLIHLKVALKTKIPRSVNVTFGVSRHDGEELIVILPERARTTEYCVFKSGFA